jgi:isopentenyl diphosphate isomerase/L-lactate dehydrogenase-like FMN-dependent dehydrogenase
MGGIGTGSAFRANLQSLAALRFDMRVMHAAVAPDTRTTLLGRALSLPILAAPMGGVAFNMGGKIDEEAYILAKLQGCCAMGTLGCTGDGAPDFIHRAGFKAIAALDGRGIPFIKPWERPELDAKLALAAASGSEIVGMDLDAAGLITLRLMGRPVAPKPPAALREIIARNPMRWILKGIMTPDEARLAVDVGAQAIVVSNHGGRVLDSTPGAAEVLPAIAAAVKGQLAILADGGIRSGGDVLKMLALGADAVMIGRPFAVAVHGGGAAGVERYLQRLRDELLQAMILTGCDRLAAAGPGILHRPPAFPGPAQAER